MNIVQLNNIILMKAFLITMVILMCLSTFTLFSLIANGDYLIQRIVLSIPFTYVVFKIIRIIIKCKRTK